MLLMGACGVSMPRNDQLYPSNTNVHPRKFSRFLGHSTASRGNSFSYTSKSASYPLDVIRMIYVFDSKSLPSFWLFIIFVSIRIGLLLGMSSTIENCSPDVKF